MKKDLDFIGVPIVKLKDYYKMIKAKAQAEAEEHRKARKARKARHEAQNADDDDSSGSEPKRERIRARIRLQ